MRDATSSTAIARGGMGVVLKGRDVDLGRDVAVKVLLERHRSSPELVRRFVEEAQIAGQLQHPGIVPVYELGRLPDDRLYIAMKLIRGRTLAALLEGRIDASADRPRYLAVFEPLCQAMAYAHSYGVIHRDLKPSNVMVGGFGEVQVMDWGLAKVIDRGGVADEERSLRSQTDIEPVRTLRTGSTADESRAGSVLGTPSYMAPEQARGMLDTLDERADVFGLGAILCEILTGLPPYTGSSGNEAYRKAQRADLAEAQARLEACGAEAELVALAKTCLAAAPRDRPRDAGVVVAALTAHLVGVQERLKVAELARARAESRAAEERKRRLLVACLAASLLALATLGGGGGLWLARQRAARTETATREATTTLHEASLLLGRARSAPEGELTPWAEATQAAKRAEAVLARAEIRPDLRSEIGNLVATVDRERDRAEERSKDRRTLERLASIHTDIALHLDYGRADREYATAFREYGLDVDRHPPADAGARIAASPIAAEMVDALDQWAFVRRVANPRDASKARRLSAVAQAADPDPWRCRLREALDLEASDLERARATFRELAASATEEVLHRESISRLAYALGHLGEREKESALLRRAQRAHPEDFWINFDLARSLMGAGRPEEAARFYTAAVAIRPRSELALRGLREALRAAGRSDWAAADLRTPGSSNGIWAGGCPSRSCLGLDAGNLPMPRTASTVKTGAGRSGAAEASADRVARARRASRLLRLPAQPTRLRVLMFLGDDELHVGANSQPAASHQLAVLRRGGVIARRRPGAGELLPPDGAVGGAGQGGVGHRGPSRSAGARRSVACPVRSRWMIAGMRRKKSAGR
jgi:eukaryotic-like serine/threonine-protein kinase